MLVWTDDADMVGEDKEILRQVVRALHWFHTQGGQQSIKVEVGAAEWYKFHFEPRVNNFLNKETL